MHRHNRYRKRKTGKSWEPEHLRLPGGRERVIIHRLPIIKEKRTVLGRKRIPLNQNICTADFRIGVPFEQNLHYRIKKIIIV